MVGLLLDLWPYWRVSLQDLPLLDLVFTACNLETLEDAAARDTSGVRRGRPGTDMLHTTGDLRGFRIGHHAPGGRGPRTDCNRPSGSSTALHLLRIMDRRGQHEIPRGCKRKNALEPTCPNSQLLISALLTLNFFLSEIQVTIHVYTISCSVRVQRC